MEKRVPVPYVRGKEILLYADVIDAAERAGWRLFRMLDLAGKMPFDIVGWTDKGRAVGIEVKMERRVGGLTVGGPMPSSWWTGRRHQLGWLKQLANNGGLALIMVYRADRKGGGWTLLTVNGGLTGDLRMLPVSVFEPVDLVGGLEDWICGSYLLRTST